MVVLTGLATADALRRGTDPAPALPPRNEAQRAPATRFAVATTGGFEGAGPYLHNRVERNGREYLSAEAIEAAFPVPVDGPLDISKIAVAPDGTLVLAVYRFPAEGEAHGALEVWDRRRLVSAFPVPSGYFGGGLGFSGDAKLIATFSYDGAVRGVFDRSGRRLGGSSVVAAE